MEIGTNGALPPCRKGLMFAYAYGMLPSMVEQDQRRTTTEYPSPPPLPALFLASEMITPHRYVQALASDLGVPASFCAAGSLNHYVDLAARLCLDEVRVYGFWWWGLGYRRRGATRQTGHGACGVVTGHITSHHILYQRKRSVSAAGMALISSVMWWRKWVSSFENRSMGVCAILWDIPCRCLVCRGERILSHRRMNPVGEQRDVRLHPGHRAWSGWFQPWGHDPVP